jgi:hypothetical protein
MRLIIDSLIAIMLAAILGGLLLHYRAQEKSLDRVGDIQTSLAVLREQVQYQRALGQVAASEDGYPIILSPLWFGEKLPTNLLLSPRFPWMDIAPADDRTTHPPDPIVRHGAQACFWYNPNNGAVRARVPPGFSATETLRIYNLINGTTLAALAESDAPLRQPRPLPLVIANSTQIKAADVVERPTLVKKPNQRKGSLRQFPSPPIVEPHP